MVVFRNRESDLQKKWSEKNDLINVNKDQYYLSSQEKEDSFYNDPYTSKEDKIKFKEYREEWFRRPKEFDAGDKPLAVNCELVSTCNLACTMCYTITDKFQNSVVGAQRIMPWKIVKKIIDDVADNDIFNISFSWRGESTIWRDKDEKGNQLTFPDVLQYARDRGIPEITCLSHGQLIDKKMAEKIVLAEPTWLSFSIDGLYEDYKKIRTPPNKIGTSYDAFVKITETIVNIHNFKKKYNLKRPQIRTNTVFPAIKEYPEKYRDYFETIGVDLITVNEILDYRFHDMPDEMINQNWACPHPFQRLTISANGIIVPCTGAYNEEEGLVVGKYAGTENKTIRDFEGKEVSSSLEDFDLLGAWKSNKLNHIRQLHANNLRTEISPGCRNCHHGAVKHGADFLPKEWDTKNQKWLIHDNISEKKRYTNRGGK